MYFAYVDETGTDGASPVLVMVGIIINSERLRRTQVEFEGIFSAMEGRAAGNLRELKSKNLLSGNGVWRRVPGEERREVVTGLCQWLVKRKHHLALAAIDLDRFKREQPPGTGVDSPWLAGATHIALQIQRAHQSRSGAKGRTVMVFDNNEQGMKALAELVYSPPVWTGGYYGRASGAPALDQLIDTPFAVQSHHVGLVQVADVFAAIFRRHAELSGYDCAPKYPDERQHYSDWVEILTPRLLDKAHRWPSNASSDCARWYRAIAPSPLVDLRQR